MKKNKKHIIEEIDRHAYNLLHGYTLDGAIERNRVKELTEFMEDDSCADT